MEFIREIIGPDDGANTLQLCVRAVFLLAYGILCVRIAGRRTFADYTPVDIVVALIVGSNISRVMTGKAAVVPTLSATLLLVVLHRALAWASLRGGWLAWLIKSKPIIVIRDGVIDEAARRRADLSIPDLYEAIRSEQAETPEDVKLATVESSGKVSVIRREAGKFRTAPKSTSNK